MDKFNTVSIDQPTIYSEKHVALTASERKRKQRAKLTAEQKVVERKKDAERKRLKRASETLTSKLIRRTSANQRKRKERDKLSAEQKAAEREKDAERKRLKRESETLISKQMRRAAENARKAQYRAKKRAAEAEKDKISLENKQTRGKAMWIDHLKAYLRTTSTLSKLEPILNFLQDLWNYNNYNVIEASCVLICCLN